MKLWSEAVEWLGLSLELDGALGKRTKFQVFSTAQLMLRVTHGHTHIEKQDPVRHFHPYFADEIMMMISKFPQLEWGLKRLLLAPKRLIGAAGAVLWKALAIYCSLVVLIVITSSLPSPRV
jgi:hypothetical protein